MSEGAQEEGLPGKRSATGRSNAGERKVFVCSATGLCEINHHHTTEVRDFLARNGYQLVAEPDHATDILVMTCGALQSSEDRSVELLERLEAGPAGRKLYIMGCLPAIRPDLPILQRAVVIGARDTERLEDAFPATVPLRAVGTVQIDYGLVGIANPNPGRFTIVVAQGCLGACTYCAIRKAKGRVRSVPMAQIMEAMRAILARHKHPSIALLGEDLGAYGADIGSDPVTLLTELCGLDGDFSLEIQNFEPSRFLLFYPRLRALFAQGRIAKLHVAIQSGSDRVLRLMGRQYVVSEVAGALADLGRVAPGLVLETSFIINFPGEERPDFLDTLSLLPQFDEVVVFNFSSRYGTAAAGFAATVAPEEREARAAMIRQVQKVHPGLAFL